MTFLYYFYITLFVFVCFMLCGTILVQESKSTGLGASFGGDSGDSIFGTATADILKRFTGYLVLIFLVSCVIISLWTQAMERHRAAPLTIEQVRA